MSGGAIMRSAMVTGAAGGLGSQLVKRLAGSGFRVVAYVRDRQRAAHLAALPGVELFEGDLNDRERLDAAMTGCDQLFHLAARVHAPAGTPESEFRLVNVEGTRNVVESAIHNRVSAFVYFGTVAVYPPSDLTLNEDSPVGPHTHYGRSKLEAERLLLAEAAVSGLKATVLRLPVVYGRGDRGNVGALIEAIRRGRYLIIGSGDNEKSMVAAANVIEAAVAVADDARARGRVYIVTDARPYTQREIAVTIASLLGRPGKFFRLPIIPALVLGLAADIVKGLVGLSLPVSLDRVRKLAQNTRYSGARIVDELGIRPRVALREGLMEMIDDRREN